jgi:hypothetical protein
VVKHEGITSEMHRRRDRVSREWGRFRELQSFLADHFPDPWERIQTCGLRFKTYESRDRPGFYKLVPFSCHEVPYCIQCTRMETARRVASTLDNFNRCTPKGKQPRFVHVVQTAPIYEDGTGWGNQASRNVPKFNRIVWDTLTQHLGEGIGAVQSYQDFGERCFAKRHPHLDLTVNGWMLSGGKPAVTPTLDLAGQGRARWDQAIVQRALALNLEAERGNLHVTPVIEGHRSYYSVLRYQMRELVDLRKLSYSRREGRVWWMSYKDSSRQAFTVQDFLSGLAEYQARLQVWMEGGPSLHRAFGHMAKRSIGKTEDAMEGGPIPHGQDCPCSQCGDWDRVFLDEVEDYYARARPG